MTATQTDTHLEISLFVMSLSSLICRLHRSQPGLACLRLTLLLFPFKHVEGPTKHLSRTLKIRLSAGSCTQRANCTNRFFFVMTIWISSLRVSFYFPVTVMMRWIVLLSVCLHVISASFDYVYDEQAIMGKCTCMKEIWQCHRYNLINLCKLHGQPPQMLWERTVKSSVLCSFADKTNIMGLMHLFQTRRMCWV